jgi:hypothetical protein
MLTLVFSRFNQLSNCQIKLAPQPSVSYVIRGLEQGHIFAFGVHLQGGLDSHEFLDTSLEPGSDELTLEEWWASMLQGAKEQEQLLKTLYIFPKCYE